MAKELRTGQENQNVNLVLTKEQCFLLYLIVGYYLESLEQYNYVLQNYIGDVSHFPNLDMIYPFFIPEPDTFEDEKMEAPAMLTMVSDLSDFLSQYS